MFQLDTTSFGPYTLYTISHPASGHRFSVVPEKGGTLLDLWFHGASVLDGYATPEELDEAKWGKSAILFPFPNRLRDGSYTWQGNEYQFPINNAATGNAIHGFARQFPFQITDITTTEHEGGCTLVFDYDGHLPYYPFACRLDVRFVLSSDGVFSTTVRMENKHQAAIPAGFGWHPYFRLSPDAVDSSAFSLTACQKVGIDERMIPTGDRSTYDTFVTEKGITDTVLDNCFYFENDITAVLRHGDRTLRMDVPAAQFPYFQVFTPPHRTSVAFEPMTCNINAFNNGDGLLHLEAGEVWEGTFVCRG